MLRYKYEQSVLHISGPKIAFSLPYLVFHPFGYYLHSSTVLYCTQVGSTVGSHIAIISLLYTHSDLTHKKPQEIRRHVPFLNLNWNPHRIMVGHNAWNQVIFMYPVPFLRRGVSYD